MPKLIRVGIHVCLGAVLTFVLPLASCRPQPTQPTVRDAGVHAVHSEKLQSIMEELERPTDRLPKELDVEAERQEKISRIETLAHEMAIAAGRILDILDEVDFTEQQQKAFTELADRLQEQAKELEQEAGEGDLSRISQTMAEIAETCDFCHRRFRVLPMLSAER